MQSELSIGPAFVSILGDKYGYRPFPNRIEQHELEAIIGFLEKSVFLQPNLAAAVSLIKEWFILDENCVPPQYVLQSISSRLPDFRSSDRDRQREASSQWWSIFVRLQEALRLGANGAFVDAAIREKYLISVTEEEVHRGILKNPQANLQSICFRRKINKLSDNLHAKDIGKYVDVDEQRQIQKEAVTLLHELKEQKVPAALSSNLILDFELDWEGEHGIQPMTSETHAAYLRGFCDRFCSELSNLIIEAFKRNNTTPDDDLSEITQHRIVIQEKARSFVGRSQLVGRVVQYIVSEGSEERWPLVVYGESGSGKTSLLARALMQAQEQRPNMVFASRFVGSTSESTRTLSLIRSISLQIIRAYEFSEKFPDDDNQTFSFFKTLLENCPSAERPLLIAIDSLDQLSDTYGDWLSNTALPRNVFLVVSVIPSDPWFEQICGRLTTAEEISALNSEKLTLENHPRPKNFIQVPRLAVEEGNEIVSAMISSSSRKLTPAQHQQVLDGFNVCPLPLYLHLAVETALLWSSYTPHTPLAHSVRDLIHALFDRLERTHGRVLISRALGYITLAKYGLSGSELEDVLSCDDDVLNDVYQWWNPPVRRLPPLLWLRAKADLGTYIVEKRNASGGTSYGWYHRQFSEVAAERYNQPEMIPILARGITSYFFEKGRSIPESPLFTRSLAPQPLWTNPQTANARVVSELPAAAVSGLDFKVFETFVFTLEFFRAAAKLRQLHDLTKSVLKLSGMLHQAASDGLVELSEFPSLANPKLKMLTLAGELFNEGLTNEAVLIFRVCGGGMPMITMKNQFNPMHGFSWNGTWMKSLNLAKSFQIQIMSGTNFMIQNGGKTEHWTAVGSSLFNNSSRTSYMLMKMGSRVVLNEPIKPGQPPMSWTLEGDMMKSSPTKTGVVQFKISGAIPIPLVFIAALNADAVK
eukprot:TRINITY_DN3180_c0_g1_i6.p1 TRINITY_DN3180_c0_g1~~TRINITY_DN3180_c0_g1_i6.p1  ORF type:complete len:927 (-),score=255.74 TRINITY_DN3180_c0_g1_i6:35-2815(-)